MGETVAFHTEQFNTRQGEQEEQQLDKLWGDAQSRLMSVGGLCG